MHNVHYIVTLFTVFLSTNIQANNTDEVTHITWLQSDTPPFHLPKTEDAPTGGLCDYLVEQLINELPNITHTRLIMPQKRIGKYLDEGQTACFPCMIHRQKKNNQSDLFNPYNGLPTICDYHYRAKCHSNKPTA